MHVSGDSRKVAERNCLVQNDTVWAKKKTHVTKQKKLTNPLEGLAGYNLRRASNVIILPLEESLRTIDVSIVGVTVLILIEANPGVTQSQLCREVSIKSSNMAPLIMDYFDRGLIERERHDGRSYGLFVTSKGRRLLKKAWKFISESEAQQSVRLSKEEWGRLVSLLGALWR